MIDLDHSRPTRLAATSEAPPQLITRRRLLGLGVLAGISATYVCVDTIQSARRKRQADEHRQFDLDNTRRQLESATEAEATRLAIVAQLRSQRRAAAILLNGRVFIYGEQGVAAILLYPILLNKIHSTQDHTLLRPYWGVQTPSVDGSVAIGMIEHNPGRMAYDVRLSTSHPEPLSAYQVTVGQAHKVSPFLFAASLSGAGTSPVAQMVELATM